MVRVDKAFLGVRFLWEVCSGRLVVAGRIEVVYIDDVQAEALLVEGVPVSREPYSRDCLCMTVDFPLFFLLGEKLADARGRAGQSVGLHL